MPTRRVPEAKNAVLEVAILDVKPGQSSEFESAFGQAESIIASAKGHISHELRRCIETPDRYILLVRWESLEDHTEGFRGSPRYQEWKHRLHHYYDPFPKVEHYVSP
jgi:heme-degrading monooxygenase HmoA